MLVIGFLQIKVSKKLIKRTNLFVLLANILVSIVAYFVLASFDQQLAILAFMLGAAPTAIIAIGAAKELALNVKHVTVSVILTNVGSAIYLPIALAWIGVEGNVATWTILWASAQLILVPFIINFGIRKASEDFEIACPPQSYPPLIIDVMKIVDEAVDNKCREDFSFRMKMRMRLVPRLEKTGRWLTNHKSLSFWLWLTMITLATTKVGEFFITSQVDDIAYIALVSAIMCIINFVVGWLIGGKDKKETSQALGQKNTMFSLTVSMDLLAMAVSSGIIVYIVLHNLWNTWKMLRIKSV